MRTRRRKSFVSGFVAILGRPNAGKSTLLNRFLDTKLAIVSSKPQTTRTTIQGVLTSDSYQLIFIDTPGLHKADSLMNRQMMEMISETLDGKDVLLYVVDATQPFTPRDDEALNVLSATQTPVLLVLNKIDCVKEKAHLLPLIEAYRARRPFAEIIPVSAVTGEGASALHKAILARMPKGPAWFPAEHLTDQPERFLAAEIVREKILAVTRQEVPHSVAVLVDSWEEQPKLLRISATIYVEKQGQKAIIVGAKGAMLKRIGTEARMEIEGFLGRKVFLGLFVKVQPNWREDPGFLKELDWRSMAGTDESAAEG
ncbi:MAG: GTPase Era [Bryobacterales bacterium]|nr:GTPase Era [Bryobacterales bacterium]